MENQAKDLYLDLLKKSLLNFIYGPESERDFNMKKRIGGHDWPRHAKTMVGVKALENIRNCIESVHRDGVPGDFIETGVWRGGACIFARGIFKAYGITDRKVWVADSFKGLPPPDPKYPADDGDKHYQQTALSVSLDHVRRNFQMYGLLDDQVEFLEGFFRDTLPKAPIEQLAILRMDGDMYEATINALEFLYPKLSSGGFAIVDDYHIHGCRQAIHDYRNTHNITAPFMFVDPADPGNRVYWQK
jgi:hypothetical protein